MPEGVHPQPGHEVEILFALEVVEENTLAALKAHGISVVGGEKKTLFKIGDLIEAGHGLIVERTRSRGRLSAISFQLSVFSAFSVRLGHRSFSGKTKTGLINGLG
jgi:hypothetical protein